MISNNKILNLKKTNNEPLKKQNKNFAVIFPKQMKFFLFMQYFSPQNLL